MFIRLLRTSYTMNHALIWLVALILWIPGITGTYPASVAAAAPLYELILPAITAVPWLSAIAGLLLLTGEAYLLNMVLADSGIIPRNSILAVFIYIVVMSAGPGLLSLHPLLFANLFVILSLRNILKIYTEEADYGLVFNSTFYIALASFFYVPYFYLIIFVWLTFIVYRLDHWREWIIALTGMVVPYFLVAAMYFLFDRLVDFTEAIAPAFYFTLQIPSGQETAIVIVQSLVFILLLWSFLSTMKDLQEQKIQIRKYIWGFVWLLVVMLFLFFFSEPGKANYHLAVLALPSAMFISYHALARKKTWFFDFMILFVVVTAMIYNFTA